MRGLRCGAGCTYTGDMIATQTFHLRYHRRASDLPGVATSYDVALKSGVVIGSVWLEEGWTSDARYRAALYTHRTRGWRNSLTDEISSTRREAVVFLLSRQRICDNCKGTGEQWDARDSGAKRDWRDQCYKCGGSGVQEPE